jgi:hypothetical protein
MHDTTGPGANDSRDRPCGPRIACSGDVFNQLDDIRVAYREHFVVWPKPTARCGSN